MNARSRFPAWIPALAIAAAVRIVIYTSFQAKAWIWLPLHDGQEFLRRSASGWGALFAPDGPPFGSFLYPALLRLLGVEERGDVPILFLFQHVVGVLNTFLIFTLARRFARRGVAALVAGLWALLPITAYWEHQVSPATLAVTAILLLALAMTRDDATRAEIGALGGLAALMAPAWTLPLLVALPAWGALRAAHSRGRALAAVALPFLLVSSPMIVAGVRGHVPPAMSWESGMDAFIGHRPGATGTFRRTTPLRYRGYADYVGELSEQLGRPLTPAETGRIMGDRARREAFSHPNRTLTLAARKIGLAISPWESPLVRSPVHALGQAKPVLRIPLALEWLLLPFGVAGIVFAGRRRGALVTIAIAILAALVLRFVSSPARLPLLALFAASSAAALEAILAARGARRLVPVGFAAAALAIALLAGRPPGMNDPSEEMRTAAALAAQGANRAVALDRAQQAVRLDPGNVAARVDLASFLASEGVFADAAEQLEMAHAADSTYVPAVLALAQVRQYFERHAEAVTLYRSVLRDRPKSPQTWNDLGTAYLRLGEADSAVVCFERAVAIYPEYQVALQNLAAMRSAAAANQALFEAILPEDLTDQEIEAVALAVGALRSGDRAPAEALLASLPAARRPGDLRRPYFEALVASASGDNVLAIERLAECYGEAPGNPVLAVQLGMGLERIGRIEEAIAVLEQAVQAHPQDASLRQILAQIKGERK